MKDLLTWSSEVEAKTKEKYDKWVKEVQQTAPKLTEDKYNEIVKPGVVGRMTFSSHHLSYVDPKSLEYCDYNYYKTKNNSYNSNRLE